MAIQVEAEASCVKTCFKMSSADGGRGVGESQAQCS